MLKKKNNHVKIQMTRFSEPTVKRISISKIVSECKKRDDQLSRREISRNYLYRTSHQEMWCVITRLFDSRTRVWKMVNAFLLSNVRHGVEKRAGPTIDFLFRLRTESLWHTSRQNRNMENFSKSKHDSKTKPPLTKANLIMRLSSLTETDSTQVH